MNNKNKPLDFARGKQKNTGLTLIEVLISMFIFTALAAMVFVFQGRIFNVNNVIQSGLAIQQDARKILRPFAEEVRSATISNIGAFPISQATTTTIEFYSDNDNDGLKEKIRYFKDGDEFKKGVTKPSGNPYVYDENDEEITGVVSGIINTGSDPVFEYFDENYDGTDGSSPLSYPISVTEITLVKATLIVDEDVNKDPGAVTISTQATFRNLKDN
jgi:prepilin-type N-terminal cleavage/methylation domain-containing protein